MANLASWKTSAKQGVIPRVVDLFLFLRPTAADSFLDPQAGLRQPSSARNHPLLTNPVPAIGRCQHAGNSVERENCAGGHKSASGGTSNRRFPQKNMFEAERLPNRSTIRKSGRNRWATTTCDSPNSLQPSGAVLSKPRGGMLDGSQAEQPHPPTNNDFARV